MANADEYRRLAAECLSVAQRASDPNDRARLLDMASAFNELAARIAASEQEQDGPDAGKS